MLLLTSLGLLLIFHQIHSRVNTQITLDQKTGTMALSIRGALISLEQSFHRLEVARLATLSGCASLVACPSFIRAFKLEVQIENKIQTVIEKYWQAEKINWNSYHPILANKSEFPKFPVEIVKNQEWALELLKINRFTFEAPAKILFTIEQTKLISTAEITTLNKRHSHQWRVAWVQ